MSEERDFEAEIATLEHELDARLKGAQPMSESNFGATLATMADLQRQYIAHLKQLLDAKLAPATSEERGLYNKYTVTSNADGSEVNNAFVLKPETDRHARMALLWYARSCEDENSELAHDLREWVWRLNDKHPL